LFSLTLLLVLSLATNAKMRKRRSFRGTAYLASRFLGQNQNNLELNLSWNFLKLGPKLWVFEDWLDLMLAAYFSLN
jgi:hypothetical protein